MVFSRRSITEQYSSNDSLETDRIREEFYTSTEEVVLNELNVEISPQELQLAVVSRSYCKQLLCVIIKKIQQEKNAFLDCNATTSFFSNAFA